MILYASWSDKPFEQRDEIAGESASGKTKTTAAGLGSNARTDHLNLISNPFSGGENNG